jgi:hypothetical protein
MTKSLRIVMKQAAVDLLYFLDHKNQKGSDSMSMREGTHSTAGQLSLHQGSTREPLGALNRLVSRKLVATLGLVRPICLTKVNLTRTMKTNRPAWKTRCHVRSLDTLCLATYTRLPQLNVSTVGCFEGSILHDWSVLGSTLLIAIHQ